MQDRLSKELRLAVISSINDANEYLRNSDFIARHNAKFAVTTAQLDNAHADRQVCNLDDIFSIHVQVVAPKFVAYASPYKPSNNSQRWVSGLPPMMSRDEAGLAGHRGILNLTK